MGTPATRLPNPMYDPQRLLLVEDNEVDALLIKRSLRDSEFEVVHVREHSAIEPTLRKSDFLGILLDLHLPDSWASDTIANLPNIAHEKIIIVLSAGYVELSNLCTADLSMTLLQKGHFDIDALPEIIRSITSQHRKKEF